MSMANDFNLNVTKVDRENGHQVQAMSTVPCSIVYSIIGISGATTQFGGNSSWTETKKCF
ncbi:MAG: hypothetical protein LKH43_07965 [Lactobacillus crispatus]|jgi:hypothetical protein|nr:hypothetical protein [Lactobacillus crispatus]MCI1365968.1 hypothetical protein [Lactobacillus crispatus]MCI1494362.1 hypothetical protein [Lactobacillus crispatus]MCI1523990.1 hypothetical protein [Lactobacillus crispatus]